jgi:predicted ATPase
MKRYILTGTPGCGKTSILRALEMTGASVITEAATDVIAYKQMQGESAPWENSAFIDNIIKLQKQRQMDRCFDYSDRQFYDRSPICTYALALYLGFDPSINLMNEIDRIHKNNMYEKRVFFVENLGSIAHTEARKISFEESLLFEQIHLDAYKTFGYECVMIPAAPIAERIKMILESL